MQRQHGPTGALDGSTAADHLDHEARTAQHLARISGFLYLIIAALGAFAGSVSTGLVIGGILAPLRTTFWHRRRWSAGASLPGCWSSSPTWRSP